MVVGSAFEARGSSIPERLGKHLIVGKLATGGMASVFLARLVGPVGFENVVVVKRMLPHLAEDERFREMFADEARTVAKIRHPNVVRTFELVSEGEELYLVMEYLEGDTLQRLAHGLASRGQHLSLGQICSIIAEAAAGLHAAHELVGEDGELLGVVHRDVSPHNLFVTFDGSVKVIDFGIAKSVDQANQTSTGELKGKFAYMAPEQVAARGTSRRTDVFALGIVLWELLTRKRLFHRENQMVTLRAVTDEPTPLPSTIVDTVPPGLDAICARCLAKEPDDRFATMAELRTAILAEARKLDEPDPSGELARTMQLLFEKSIAQRRAMLRESRVAEPTSHGRSMEPAAIIDVQVDDVVTDASSIRRAETATAEKPSSRRGLWVAGGALLLAVLVIGGLAAMSVGHDTPETVAIAHETPAPTPTPPPSTVVATPEPGPTTSRVAITIESDPAGALVTVDGIARGNTPVTLDLVQGDEPVTLELTADGRRTTTTRFLPDHAQTLQIPLPRTLHGAGAHPAEAETRPGFFAFE